MKRKRLTLKQVKLLLERQGGKCAVVGCGVVLVLGPKGQHTNFIDEHIQALGRGGDNALGNRDLRCRECANRKTFHPRSKASTIGSDVFEIAKTDRMVGRRNERPKPKRKWPSRPFPKRISR